MQDHPLAQECLRRHSELKQLRAPFETLWQDAARRCLPMYADITGDVDPARRANMSDNFDSTAMLALGKFAAALSSVATPTTAKWHNIVPADPDLAENVDVMRWCEDVRDRLFVVRGHHLANFTSSVIDVYRMIGVFGHGTMFIHHEAGRAIRYMAIPAREIWIDTDAAGVLDTVHRRYELTARQSLKEFAGDDLPRDVLDMKDKRDAQDKKLCFLHCVYPNPDFDPKRMDARGKPYLSVHLYGNKVIRVSGYRTMPYTVPRYETMPGNPYGFGPGLLSLPDIKMINEMGKTTIRVAHRTVDPPLLLKDDLLAPFSTQPGFMIYGGLDDQGRPTAQPLEMGGRLDVGLEFTQSRQIPINDAFLVTLFQILVDQPQMTATEVLQRAQEKGVLLAPTMARLQSEQLGPQITRELDIGFSIPGFLPPPPPQLVESGGLLDVEYASPLAKSMQAGGDALGFQRTMEAAIPMAQVDPGVLDNFNFDEGVRVLSAAFGAPAKIMRTLEEVAAIRGQKAEAAQAQQLLAAAPVLSESAKNVAQAQAMGGGVM